MCKKKKSVYRAIILASMFISLFIFLDILLGQLLIKPSDRTFRTSHPYYHHGLIPNQKTMASWYHERYPMYTNSLGFRDSKVKNISPASDKYRILFMGDSHTEGVGMRYEDTFSGQVAASLDTSRYEVLNTAAVSYSPRIYYLKTKYLIEFAGLKFDELFVFIDLSDIQNEIVYEGFQPILQSRLKAFKNTIRHQLVNRSFTANTLSKAFEQKQTRRFLEKAAVFNEYREEEAHVDALQLYASFFSGFDDKVLLSNPSFHGVSEWIYDDEFRALAKRGLAIGRKNMQALIDLCKTIGIEVTISVHPWQEQIRRGDPSDMYVSFWEEFARDNNIGFINLYPVFINPPISAAYGQEFFIPGDNHWNRNGHMLVAREVIRTMR